MSRRSRRDTAWIVQRSSLRLIGIWRMQRGLNLSFEDGRATGGRRRSCAMQWWLFPAVWHFSAFAI
jgi:hypothetical protein